VKIISLLSLLTFIVSACAPHTINDNPAPLRNAPATYSLQGPEGALPASNWYQSFNDAGLNALIETALQNNLDVAQAFARLKQAGFLTSFVAADRMPNVDALASADVSKQENSGSETIYGAGAALSWEVDAFNRIGSLVNARQAEEKAAAADIEAVRLSLSAEVAENYYGAIAQHVQLRVLQAQAQTDQQLLDLIRQRLDAGLGTNVEVLQQQSQLTDSQSLVPPAESQLRVFENRLDVLSGSAPDALNRTKAEDNFADLGTIPPIGVPSDILLNRPDLRVFKNLLIAQDNEIAAAIADRLPSVTLTGSYLLAAGPGASANYAGGALASLVQPLLDWGKRKAEVERNRALYEERLAAFTQAYLLALEDVENALYQETKQREYIKALEERSRVLNQTVLTAQSSYKEGQSDYLPVLNALKDLRAVDRDLVAQRLNLILYRIQLYRALGGQAYQGQTS